MPQNTQQYTSFTRTTNKLTFILAGIAIVTAIGFLVWLLWGAIIGMAVGGLIGYGTYKVSEYYKKREQQRLQFDELPSSSLYHDDVYHHCPHQQVTTINGEGLGSNIHGFVPPGQRTDVTPTYHP